MLNPSANVTMEYRELLTVALDFGTAILLGALIGIEREKRKAEDEETGHIAGLRTFILLALLGAAAGWLSRDLSTPWVLAAALLIVGAVVVAGYFVTARPGQDGKGLTTEVAAVIVFLLGAMIMLGYEELAIGLGVITAAVLAYKQPLHGFVEKLGWDDVYAGVRLLIATFIALPLLPNEPIDPWGALNPYKLWLLVILISSLSLVGYVLTRLLGSARGTALTGLAAVWRRQRQSPCHSRRKAATSRKWQMPWPAAFCSPGRSCSYACWSWSQSSTALSLCRCLSRLS